MNLNLKKTIFVIVFLSVGINFYAQEILRITQTDLDTRFLKNNFNLIASHANIDINRAYKQQALLWDNPYFDFETALFGKPMDVGKILDFQQYYFQVQQIIRTSKKLKKNADISEATAQLSEAQFFDLTRTLRHQLHSDFNDLATVYEKSVSNKMQIDSFSKLINAVTNEVNQGSMARKDLLLLQTQLVQLQRDAAELERSRIPLQTDIQNLLGEKNEIVVVPIIENQPPTTNNQQLSVADLINTALESRPDLKIAAANTNVQEKNLIYQKALSVPDLTAALSFDKNGSYAPDYVGINLGLPLPVFNKNQYNIKAAQLVINQQKTLQEAALVQVSTDVINAYRRLEDLEKFRNGPSGKIYKDYEDFFNTNVINSYRTHQTTLVDFFVFYQTYQQNKIQQIDMDAQIRQAIESLNFVVGKKVK